MSVGLVHVSCRENLWKQNGVLNTNTAIKTQQLRGQQESFNQTLVDLAVFDPADGYSKQLQHSDL